MRWLWPISAAVLVVVALWWFRPLGRDDSDLRWEDFQPPADIALRPWTHIVIHHSASRRGSSASIDAWHRKKGWDGLGYHVVIGNGTDMALGRIEQGFRWHLQREGAHAGGGELGRSFNQLGIGICLIGDFNRDQPDAWQEERLAQLCALLIHNIPTLSVGRIIGHQDVPGKQTDCPGSHLSVDRLRYRVRELL